MLNTSAPLFVNQGLERDIKRQEAELYSRLYPIAAEDFSSTADLTQYATDVKECLLSLQRQIKSLMRILSKHTHNVPPHTHTIEPHVHTTSAPGFPTGPNVNGLVSHPTPLVTNVPTETASIYWTNVQSPLYKNTTGVPSNIGMNRVTYGLSKVGPLVKGQRRAKIPSVLLEVGTVPLIEGLSKV